MDGFKNTTKTRYDTVSGRTFANGGMTVSRNDMADGQGPMSKPAMVAKYAKGGHVTKAEKKIGRVMTEFTEGKLHSGSKEGPKVKNTKQAVAIALNEARAAGAKIPRVQKAKGGMMDEGISTRPVDRNGRRLTLADLEASNRDVGGMSRDDEQRAREAVARGNRMQAEEAGESRLVAKKAVRKGVPVDSRKAMIGGPEAADAYMARLPRSNPATRAPDRIVPGYKPGTRSGLKKGGLAVMPKGKGC